MFWHMPHTCIKESSNKSSEVIQFWTIQADCKFIARMNEYRTADGLNLYSELRNMKHWKLQYLWVMAAGYYDLWCKNTHMIENLFIEKLFRFWKTLEIWFDAEKFALICNMQYAFYACVKNYKSACAAKIIVCRDFSFRLDILYYYLSFTYLTIDFLNEFSLIYSK